MSGQFGYLEETYKIFKAQICLSHNNGKLQSPNWEYLLEVYFVPIWILDIATQGMKEQIFSGFAGFCSLH